MKCVEVDFRFLFSAQRTFYQSTAYLWQCYGEMYMQNLKDKIEKLHDMMLNQPVSLLRIGRYARLLLCNLWLRIILFSV